MISIVAAYARDRVIGYAHAIPWDKTQQGDIQRFRELTYGKTIILGQRTFDELPSPLEGRKHIVITHHLKQSQQNVEYLNYDQAVQFIADTKDELYGIGGQQIYELFMPFAQKAYLTEINGDYKGDTFFPELTKDQWQLESKKCFVANTYNKHDYCFLDYRRKKIT